MAYGRAFVVMLVTLFVVGAFFAGAAPAVQGVLDAVAQNQAVQSSNSPVSVGIIGDIRTIVFIIGPMMLVLAGVLLPFVFAVRREVFAGRR
jgi:phosphotransferase system  glucose/maltose/N-acetylglucosamine-specific IIC component